MANLIEYVEWVRSGQAMVPGGGPKGAVLVERFEALGTDDLEALTSEAYNQGALPDDLPWEKGLSQVKAAFRA